MARTSFATFKGVMGINRRNLEYVYRLNPRFRFPLADDKLATKDILRQEDLPVPPTLLQVTRHGAINGAIRTLAGRRRFAVKPSRSFGGKGLLLAAEPSPGGGWRTHSGRALTVDALRYHLGAILSGMYALDQLNDRALVEPLLEDGDPLRGVHGGSGLSDVRLVVIKSQPVMGMLRLPCRESGGVANLHGGGIGVGIDMDSGITTHGIRRRRPIEAHPDTRAPLRGIRLPHWRDLVGFSMRVNSTFGMDYLGVDFVIDRQAGPLILEVNARPGLDIQIANRRGLLDAIRSPVAAGQQEE